MNPQTDRLRLRAMILLGVSIFCLALGINSHVAMNVNYLHELLGASSWQQGYLESIRETPGILSFFLVGLLAARSEPRVASIMLLVVGAGLMGYRWLSGVHHVIIFALTWSFGFHVWAPLSASMQLGMARQGREGRTVGIFGAVGAAGTLTALGTVYVLKVYGGFGMRDLFLIGGAFTALGALPLALMPDLRVKAPERMTLKRALSGRYRLFCGLELLDGMRRQIFLLFAVLALVREYGVQVHSIAALMFVNQALCLFLAPLAGRLVDRVGERPVLSGYFTAVGIIFLLYASITEVKFLFVIYVIDNALFVLKIAVATYANRIAASGERTQLLAMGTTMNHIGAVTLPVVGGALYVMLGYRFPFYCGVLIALVSLIVTQRIPARSSLKPEMQ